MSSINLKKLIISLGFSNPERNLFMRKSNEVFHIIYIKVRPTYPREIILSVWHPAMLSVYEIEENEEVEYKKGTYQEIFSQYTPVFGGVSKIGLNFHGYPPVDLDTKNENLISYMIEGFFCKFQIKNDIENAFGYRPNLVQYVDGIKNSTKTYSQNIESISICKNTYFPLDKMNILQEKVLKKLKTSLSNNDINVIEDSNIVEGGSVIAVINRKRKSLGQMFDCVYIQIDDFGSFVWLDTFPFTTLMWKADKSTKNRFTAYFSEQYISQDGAFIWSIDDFLKMEKVNLLTLILDALNVFSSVKDPIDYAIKLPGGHFYPIRKKLKAEYENLIET